jgi:fumarate reductase iron-sulfur subunit
VPRRDSQTVLDVVTHVQRHLEPTLSYRFACRVGMCGSCAMTVNGQARWTCRTHVSKVVDGRWPAGDRAAGQPAGDQGPGHRHERLLRQVGERQGAASRAPPHGTTSSPACSPDSPERQAANAGIECIGCAVCYASCDVVQWRPDYLGPAALNRAWTLVNDVRDVQHRAPARGGRRRRLPVLPHAGLVHRALPQGIAPTLAIAGLKRKVARAAVKGEL